VKGDREIFESPFALPDLGNLRWDNFERAWVQARLSRYFLNSVLVTLGSTLGTLLLGSMAAYALSRFRFRGGRAAYLLFLAGLMIPAQLAIIPLFFEMRSLGLLDSHAGLITAYVAASLPFSIFVLAGYFRSLPSAALEAARMDGCGEWRVFWNVALPMARPALVTVAIVQSLGFWNEFFMAFMFLSGEGSETLRTLPLGLADIAITSQYQTDWGVLFAGLVLVMIPALLMYVLLQRFIIQGVTVGAVRG
jgi:ABC-type glycerol-3-phosphate transport system permease component